MESFDKKERFIELRAQGISYEKAAQELGVTKQTLINWGHEFSIEIRNLRSARIEALLEQHKASRIARLRILCQIFEKAAEELNSRNLSGLLYKELFDIYLRLGAEIKSIDSTIRISKREDIPDVLLGNIREVDA